MSRPSGTIETRPDHAAGKSALPEKFRTWQDRRQSYLAAIIPKILALYRSGLNMREIADHLNHEKIPNSLDGRWTQYSVLKLIERHASQEDADEHSQRAKERLEAPFRLVWKRAAELWREGLSLDKVGERIEADEQFKGTGSWSGNRIRDALLKYMDPAEYKAQVVRASAQGAKNRIRKQREHNDANTQRVLELFDGNPTYGQLVAHLPTEGILNSEGKPYDISTIRKLVLSVRSTTNRPKRPARPVVLGAPDVPPLVLGRFKLKLTKTQHKVVKAVLDAAPNRFDLEELQSICGDAWGRLDQLRKSDPDWKSVIHFPGDGHGDGYWIGY